MGSQGDGSAQLVARGESDRDEVMRILDREPGLSSLGLIRACPDVRWVPIFYDIAPDLRPVRGQTIVDV